MKKIYCVSLGIAFLLAGTAMKAQINDSSTISSEITNASIANTPATISIPTSQLSQFNSNSPAVRQLISAALKLANQKLTYKYGSANPLAGGMDCSGTIYYLLTLVGIKNPPRDATGLYQWVWQHGHFYAVNSNHFSSFEFAYLKPGDLLFWEGTYTVNRDPPISHVMLYLGMDKQGNPLMFGASDGRTYQGISRHGVSVFDFVLPEAGSKSRFLGYSCIPQITC